MKPLHLWTAAAVLAVLSLSGCGGAVSKPSAEPTDPDPLPIPSLTGTWAWTDEFDDSGLTFSLLLTFIGDRYIEIWERHEADGTRTRWSNEQGGWSVADGVLTKDYYLHDFDEGTASEGSVDKAYSFEDADTLRIECWTCNLPSTYVDTMTRVADPLPDLEGSWIGYPYGESWTVELTISGSAITYVEMYHDDGSSIISTGTGTLDPETYFIEIANLVDNEGKDGPARLAVAPGFDGTFNLSPYWVEPPIAEQRFETERHPHMYPYGLYHLQFERAGDT